MFSAIAFYLISALLVVSALAVVLRRDTFECALYLAGFLSAVAGFFVLLGADFLAAAQILLYVGGVIVIIAFAVLLSSIQQVRLQPQVNAQWVPATVASAVLAVVLLVALRAAPVALGVTVHEPTTAGLGQLLLSEMALPFEAVSLVLLAALVGAVLFSRREKPQSAKNAGAEGNR